jgi:hypothetical protein
VLGATFDEKVYKPSEQLLNCVMCHKGVVSRKGEPLMVDQRVLRPVAAFAKEPLRSFIVQHLEGSECELGVEALLVRLRGKPSTRPHLPSLPYPAASATNRLYAPVSGHNGSQGSSTHH